MNITDGFNEMLNEYKMKKDILDNHTDAIVKEMKEWCVSEAERIIKDRKDILDFFLANKELADGLQYNDWTNGRFCWSGFGINLCGDFTEMCKKCYDFSDVHLLQNVGNLPTHYHGKNLADLENDTNTSIDYWMDVKNYILNENANLKQLALNVKNLISAMIMNQNKRFVRLQDSIKDMDNGKVVEVRISIRG